MNILDPVSVKLSLFKGWEAFKSEFYRLMLIKSLDHVRVFLELYIYQNAWEFTPKTLDKFTALLALINLVLEKLTDEQKDN